MGCSLLDCKAADLVFFVLDIRKRVEGWDRCLINLEDMLKNESTMPKEFTFEVLKW